MGKIPSAHASQPWCPHASLNEPPAHTSQGPPGGPAKPALHAQLALLLLSGGEVELAKRHGMQGPGPTASLKVPAGQLEQLSEVSSSNPTSQAHAAAESLPSGEKLSEPGQAEQSPGPASTLNVPLAHASHGCGPALGFVKPGAHMEQLTPGTLTSYPGPHWHCCAEALASGDTKFSGHGKHTPGPTKSLYVPGGHGKQPEPPGEGVADGKKVVVGADEVVAFDEELTF